MLIQKQTLYKLGTLGHRLPVPALYGLLLLLVRDRAAALLANIKSELGAIRVAQAFAVVLGGQLLQTLPDVLGAVGVYHIPVFSRPAKLRKLKLYKLAAVRARD